MNKLTKWIAAILVSILFLAVVGVFVTFVLLTCTGAEAAAKVESLKQKMNEAVDSNALPPGLTLSIGYAEIPSDTADIFPFIRLADQNMYADKIKGSH